MKYLLAVLSLIFALALPVQAQRPMEARSGPGQTESFLDMCRKAGKDSTIYLLRGAAAADTSGIYSPWKITSFTVVPVAGDSIKYILYFRGGTVKALTSNSAKADMSTLAFGSALDSVNVSSTTPVTHQLPSTWPKMEFIEVIAKSYAGNGATTPTQFKIHLNRERY